jgi:prephenate dehydratase
VIHNHPPALAFDEARGLDLAFEPCVRKVGAVCVEPGVESRHPRDRNTCPGRGDTSGECCYIPAAFPRGLLQMVKPKRAAFQGEPGANSHIACRGIYPAAEPLPCATFEDCFSAVEKGSAEVAVIPIENSVAGRVADIHHLLPDSGLHIVAEHFMPIHFHLMAPPGATLKSIKAVHSHVHALGQCRKIIRQHKWKAVIAGDTAGAAREIAALGSATDAALAPRLAAETYGLTILRENVEDEAHNTTRFIVLAKDPLPAKPGGRVVTTFVFRVRNVPAALYKALGGFATNGVNMTKLESYQLGGQFTATQFYADVEGHPEDRSLMLALEELAFFSTEVKVLGVYPAAKFREGLA